MGNRPGTIHPDSAGGVASDSRPIEAEPPRNQNNYRITDTDQVGVGSLKRKCRDNLAAIDLLKRLEVEARPASNAEKRVLVRYVGWGGLPQVFDSWNDQWKEERERLEQLLTPDEFESARASTLNAHYTAPAIIRAMYALLQRLGFTQGRVLEPACGLGHFIGLMPDEMHGHSRITGIAIDSLTARLARVLYPDADIRHQPFEEAKLADGFFDVAIGNIPFGDYRPYDPRFKSWNFLIHDYFFAAALEIRLIYAPHGENSGNITFTVRYMAEVAGRPILAALHMLLGECCSAAAPSTARLPALLARSRDYQSTVSTQLAGQVLDALYELLRGFQAADERAKGELLRAVVAKNPDDVYSGLLTVLMRMVFLLFAEDRGIVPTDPKTKRATGIYVRNYSVHGLFERLRADAERYPDTMDQRYGAWAQLLALFRAVHDGCKHPQMQMPPRRGNLFDPDRFKFLEGRTTAAPRPPLVSDGTLFRVLRNLLILDGERLSYRTLDVEEIGSVYQTVMGFRLEVAAGPSIAIKGQAKKGSVPAATTINLDELLAAPAKDRPKWLAERTDQELSGDAEKALKAAARIDDLLAALERKVARNATLSPVAKGGLVLQPTDERRRSGSHYTPRSFTQPIVRKTLQRILQRLGAHPTPGQILALKICDLAVGSAAFLVETCRQLFATMPGWHCAWPRR